MSAADAGLVELVPDVHAWVQPDGSWWINNAGVVCGTEGGGALIIDTCCTAERTRRFLSAARRAAGQAPLRFALNTHLHGDHTYGNYLLPQDTVLIAHEATRAGMIADPFIDACPPVWRPAPDWSGARLRTPDLTMTGALTLHLGGRRVELHHPGYTAHTSGDVVAWLPAERVLFTGDLVFHRVTPLLLMGSLEGALRSVEWLAGFEADHIVPGHGGLVGGGAFRTVLAAHDRYYRFITETAAWGREEGLGPLEAANAVELGEFAQWQDPERLVLNLHRAYAEAQRGDVDLMAAFADAITYNGGPLHCAV
ncbi:cyclase [Nocardiopsis mwathae]|uniref:Cyclase n=1 Tax=Nocardiopsis mwathae TaxID=1472723 RepID=A0A7W9YGA3_9ACTN|nr:MBL fold metallo-hydrolase [Nocardiopsis mwathae]MBB6171609.1 cyclase [Nocardiopsis mwathae]